MSTWEDIVENYENFNEQEEEKHYKARPKENEYFNKLNGIYHTEISRLGLSFATQNGIKEKQIFKPVQWEFSSESKQRAANNRKALAVKPDDSELKDFVATPLIEAYKTYINPSTPANKKDRSGSALMLCFSQKWDSINRSSMVLDPDGRDKIVDIADVIISLRDKQFKIPFHLEHLTGWKIMEGGLGDERIESAPTPMSASNVDKIINRLSKRFHKRLVDNKIAYVGDVNEIKLCMQAFIASLKLQEAKFIGTVDGKSKVPQDLQSNYQRLFAMTRLGRYCEQMKEQANEISKSSISNRVDVPTFAKRKILLKLPKRKRKKVKKPESPPPEASPAQDAPPEGLDGPPMDGPPPAAVEPPKKKKEPTVRRAPECTEEFLQAGNDNLEKFEKLLQTAPDVTRYKKWSPQVFALRLHTDRMVRLAIRFRHLIDERMLELRQEARRQALGYASIQPLYEQIPEFNKKYARPDFRRVSFDVEGRMIIKNKNKTETNSNQLQVQVQLSTEGLIDESSLLEYERRHWAVCLGYKQVEKRSDGLNIGGLPNKSGQPFHPLVPATGNSMDINDPLVLINWAFTSHHSVDLMRHFLPSIDSSSVAIDFSTDTVNFVVRREGITVKESHPLSYFFTERSKIVEGGCVSNKVGNGIFFNNSTIKNDYIEWKLINENQLEELKEDKSNDNLLPWLIRHEELLSAEILINHLSNVDIVDGNGFTPLQLACTKDGKDLVIKILSHNPDVNLQNFQGNTALHLAIGHERFDIAALLLNYNCDITIKNKENKTPFEMFPNSQSRSKFFLEQAFSYTSLKARSYSFWFYILEIRDVDEVKLGNRVQDFVQTYTSLAYAKDPHGRVAVDMATPYNKQVINSIFLWHGRYRVVESRPEHQSATCYVYRALDESDVDENGNFRQVALKLVRMKAHFQREIMARTREFHPDYVVDIIARFPPTDEELESWPDDVSALVTAATNDRLRKGSVIEGAGGGAGDDVGSTGVSTKAEAEQFFCLVMPYASRNMFVALKQERFAGRNMEEVRHIFTQLLTCASHLHERGVLHADLKTLNMVRMETQWKLIDMDASCIIGQETVGYKTSSAYLPPEAIFVDKTKSVVKVRSCAPQFVHESAEVRGYELLMADPSFDVWSLGCILYQMCNADVRPLFQGGQDDNLSLDPSEDDNLFLLAEWSTALKARKLQRVVDPLARNLLSQMLQKDPRRRPTIMRILAHPFLASAAKKATGGPTNNTTSWKVTTANTGTEEKKAFDVFLSYRRNVDFEHAEILYKLLTAKGLNVWWDEKCIPSKYHNGQVSNERWNELCIDGLMKSRAFIVLLSPHAVNHPNQADQNFSMQQEDSIADIMLIQQRLALELRSLKLLSKVFPVMIGDKIDNGNGQYVYQNFFACKGNPAVKDIIVKDLELALRYHLDRHALGSPLEESKTIKAIVSSVLACQGAIILGDAGTAFDEPTKTIVTMLSAQDDDDEDDQQDDDELLAAANTGAVATSLMNSDDAEIQQLKNKLAIVRGMVGKIQTQLQERWDDYLVNDDNSGSVTNLDDMRAMNQSLDQSLQEMKMKIEKAKERLAAERATHNNLKQRCVF